jgi:hypothetical protein
MNCKSWLLLQGVQLFGQPAMNESSLSCTTISDYLKEAVSFIGVPKVELTQKLATPDECAIARRQLVNLALPCGSFLWLHDGGILAALLLHSWQMLFKITATPEPKKEVSHDYDSL